MSEIILEDCSVTPGVLSDFSPDIEPDYILTKNHIIIPSEYLHLNKKGFYFTSLYDDKSKGFFHKKKVYYINYGDTDSNITTKTTNIERVDKLFKIFTKIQIELDEENKNG